MKLDKVAMPGNAGWFRVDPPVRVQAVQLTNDVDWEEIAAWCSGRVINYELGDSGEYITELVIPGTQPAYENFWVIRGCTGHFFVRESDEFTATYRSDHDPGLDK